MRSTGSTPTYSGRISRSRTRSGLIVYGQPIRSATTDAGIRGHSVSSALICGSNPSTTRPRGARWYFGGRSESNAARTVFRATPIRRAISLMGTPSALYRRRISAQSSTFSTLLASARGQL